VEHVEETVEEVQPDGSIVLRRVIIPALSKPEEPGLPEDGDALPGIVPMGEPIPDLYGEN
jgi:hypothetical protein